MTDASLRAGLVALAAVLGTFAAAGPVHADSELCVECLQVRVGRTRRRLHAGVEVDCRRRDRSVVRRIAAIAINRQGAAGRPQHVCSFLIPALVFCAYFLSHGQGSKLLLNGALAIVLLGILLSFSRIAVVASLFCFLSYIFFHNRGRPRRLVTIIGGLVAAGVVMFAFASITSAEFMAKLLDRLTFAKSYGLGEEGRYSRYALVLPMIASNPIGVGVLQLEKIFPEPIHNIWLSSFVNYGWVGGISYVTLAIGSIVVSLRNYRRTKDEITIALLISLVGIVFCSTRTRENIGATHGCSTGSCGA